MSNGNGTTKILIQLLIYVVIALIIGGFVADTRAQSEKTDDKAIQNEKDIAVLKQCNIDIRSQLSRIENKLDKALEK